MNLLERIVAARRASIALARRSEIAPAQRSTAPRLFEAALRAPGRRIIAEIKRRSPSRGPIRDPLDPRAIAAQYARAGAAAISVLTEPEFFGGSDADLVAARDAVTLPVLRKDFILDAGQIAESRALGADAVLLIAAVLAPEELALLVSETHRSGMAALVEVHDERELDAALASGTKIVGVNSRDLRDFSVDLERAVRLARRIPSDLVAVAESGIRDVADIERLEDAGYRAFLVGESLLGAPDPGAALGELLA